MNKQDLLLAAQKLSFLEWVLQNKIKTERGLPVEFREHLFLYDIYDDWNPKQAAVKSSQIGFSLMAVLKSLYAAKMREYNVIYTLPTFDFIRQFVPEKVNKVIEVNEDSMSGWIQGKKDTLDQKQVGDRTIYFTSAFEHKAKVGESAKGIALTSDLNLHDEVNRSSLSIIEQYRSRLDFSKYKGQWMFSNPTFPNVGVSEWWNRSDQKHWFITCSRCKHKQYMSWPDSVDKEKEVYVCKKCGRELSYNDRRVGEWVKKWSNKDEISGYWINQMMAPWKPAHELISLEKEKDPAYFHNFVLGLPYAGSDVVVDSDLILNNITQKESSKADVAMGVDVGIKKHVVVGTEYGIFQVFKTESWEDVERVFLKYDATMVIDALPDITIPRELVEKYKGRVFINYYKRGTKDRSAVDFKKKDKYGVVYTDRTRIIEQAVDELAKGKRKFHLSHKELEEYIEHWSNMYRYTEEDRMGNPVVRWESSTNDDHYVHAHAYYLIALEKAKSREGSVFRDKKGKGIHGEESFVVDDEGKMPGMDIKDFVGKPKKDWRYV